MKPMNKARACALLAMLAAMPAAPVFAQATMPQPPLQQSQQAQTAPQAMQQTVATPAAVPAGKLERLVAPLNGVSSLTVAEPSMVDMKNAADCKLSSKILRQKLVAALGAQQLPLTPDNAAPRPDLIRLTLKPEVATLKDGVVNCVSWVSLTAQQQDALKLPPNPDRKPVTIAYWSRGALIMTPIVDHATGVADVYDKLARVLARQWRIDNPDSAGTPDTTPPETLDSIKR